MEFDIPKDQSSIIKVIGVGGGGSNAVNHMFNQGLGGVDFIVCNTDKQALDASPIPHKIQLGPSLTEGRGAGSIPEIGRNAAAETIDEIEEFLAKNTKMVFITAGMGGGTGTGAAPVIAKTARDLGILTVGIVTIPFNFEGRKRRKQAEQGVESLREVVDTLLVINNEKLREISGNLTLGRAFAEADDILATAAKGISEVISVTGAINVDFNDVNTVMKDSGVAVMGSAVAEGENRAIEAVQSALSSPLLNDNDISGATYVLLNITYGTNEILMDEISDITDYIQNEAGSTADVIWGHGLDESLNEGICVTIIATGFKDAPETGLEKAPKKKVNHLEAPSSKEITEPIKNATASSAENKYEEPSSEEPYLKTEKEEETVENTSSSDENAKEVKWELDNSLFSQPKEVKNEEAASTQDSSKKDEQKKEVRRYFLDEDVDVELDTSIEDSRPADTLTREQQKQRNEERLNRIKNYTSHLNSAEGLRELEKEPAFKRRKMDLDMENHSSEESSASRFNISDNNDASGRGFLNDSNSFLHDNVD